LICERIESKGIRGGQGIFSSLLGGRLPGVDS
jgi:hypothetical protein